MKCVSNLFCDKTGTMVFSRVELTAEEKRQRGNLIPCMNQVSGQFDVCCKRPVESQPRDATQGSQTSAYQQSLFQESQDISSQESPIRIPREQTLTGKGSSVNSIATFKKV